MQWVVNFTVQYGGTIQVLASLIMALSALGAFWKWRNDVNFRRSTHFQELVSENRINPEMRSEIYILDDDEKKWLNEEFYGSDKEKNLDKVLLYFCYEVYLYNHGYIKKEEFQPISYELNRALINPQLQEYLFNLQMYAKGKGMQSPYKYLVKYGLRNGLLDSSFSYRFSTLMKKELKFRSYYKEWLEKERAVCTERSPQLDSCNCKPRSIIGRVRDSIRSSLFSLRWFF